MTAWTLTWMLTGTEWLLVALVQVRAVLLRRYRRCAAQADALNRCRECGCVDTHACIEISLCEWTEPDLCSACADGEPLCL